MGWFAWRFDTIFSSGTDMNFFKSGRKIIAIGRNFADHAKELGNSVPSQPFFFLKPTSSYLTAGNIEIPPAAQVHHEIELGVVIGKSGRDISKQNAFSHIAGYCLALDMTARNIQKQAAAAGLPWSAAKGYDTFTPISSFIPKQAIPDPHDVDLLFSVDGVVKQNGNTRDMIFRIPELISHVSSIMTLEEGDLILTGTPKGVGQVLAGQVVEGQLKVAGEKVAGFKFGVIDRT